MVTAAILLPQQHASHGEQCKSAFKAHYLSLSMADFHDLNWQIDEERPIYYIFEVD